MTVLPAPVLRALAALPLLSLLMAVAGAGTPTRGEAWRWPLDATPVVVRPFDPPSDPWGAGHRGVDLAADRGQPVRAPQGGTVTFAGAVAGRPVVVITHPGGLRTTLEPVAATVAVGTPVTSGDTVGSLAPTPGHCAPATCLHWGIRRGPTYLDPLSLVGPRRVVLLPVTAGGSGAGGPG